MLFFRFFFLACSIMAGVRLRPVLPENLQRCIWWIQIIFSLRRDLQRIPALADERLPGNTWRAVRTDAGHPGKVISPAVWETPSNGSLERTIWILRKWVTTSTGSCRISWNNPGPADDDQTVSRLFIRDVTPSMARLEIIGYQGSENFRHKIKVNGLCLPCHQKGAVHR